MTTAHARFTIDADRVADFTAVYLRTFDDGKGGTEHAFVESSTAHATPKLLAALADRGMKREDVRWIVVTHAHLDHAAGAGALMAACPNATLLAHPRSAKHLVDPRKLVEGAKAVYGEARFDAMYGKVDAIAADRVRALADGETFALGDATLRALHTAGHAWHHMVVDDPATGTVFTGDSFGLVYPALQKRGLFALATTSPTGFHAAEARKAIDRVLATGEPTVCPTHFGEARDPKAIADQVRAWIDRSERWVDEAAKSGASRSEMEAAIASKLRRAIEDESRARDLAFGDAEWKVLALDVELNSQGLAHAAEAMRNGKSEG